MNRLHHLLYLVSAAFLAMSVSASAASTDEEMTALRQLVFNTSQFNRLCPQEKVYLHFDNTAWFQGDVVWFAAHVVDAVTGCPSRSRVLYVDLLSPSGTLLRQLKLKVEDGRCHGSFPLVDHSTEKARALRGVLSYPSGYYEVRAYTLNMLNFDSRAIFSRVIPVYQAPGREGDFSHPVLNRSIAPWVETQRPKPSTDELSVAFYPEGGNLVQGIPCRVAFKAIDASGNGVPVVGVVKGEEGEGEDLALLSTAHDGMGSFVFTPVARRHSVIITYQGKRTTFRLPDAISQGVAVQVDNLHDDRIVGKLAVNASARNRLNGQLLGISLLCRGQVCLFDTLRLSPALAIADAGGVLAYPLSLDKSGLPTGVHQLTFFTTQGEVLAERLLFINNGLSSGRITATPDAAIYEPYAPVSVRLHAADADGAPLSTAFSVAVRDGQDMGTAYRVNVLTDMLLSSELRGFIADPEWYFETDDRQHAVALDLLMLTQGWTRYNWSQMAMVEPFTIRHYVEDGLVLDGTLLTRRGKPIPDAQVTMKLYSDDRQQKQESTITTDQNGRFGFSVEEFEGKWDMFLTARRNGEAIDARMMLDRSARPDLRTYDPAELVLPDFSKEVDDAQAALIPAPRTLQVNIDSVIHLDEVEIQGSRRYIDYMTFKAFDAEEDTEYQLDCGKFTYKVSDYLREKGYDIDLTVYDGRIPDDITDRDSFIYWSLSQCPINNKRVLWYLHDEHRNLATSGFIPGFDMDMQDIKSIIVYDSPTIYESMPIVRETLDPKFIQDISKTYTTETHFLSPGLYVVDVMMYPVTERKTRVKGTRQTTFRGYSELTEFYSPSYPDGPIPGDTDYRRTLFWAPDVKTDEEGNARLDFYNNSRRQAITVSAEGITSQGLPLISNP
jgi:hypothetical protein